MDTYQTLLLVAQSNPLNADYLALRMAYTQSSQYNPYARPLAALQAFDRAFADGDYTAALTAGEALLENNYVFIEGHFRLAAVYDRMGDEQRRDYHGKFGAGLLASIVTVSGRAPDEAFVVIDTREEYAVMGFLGLRPTMQRLVQDGDTPFDVLTAEHPTTGERLDFYFNVDLPFSWLSGR